MELYNFAPGPAMLPQEVLQQIAREIFNWRGTQVSVMEIGHRTKLFQSVIEELQHKIRQLMNIPKNYKILFVQGGGQGQFSAIPMNLLGKNATADYFVTGTWSKKAVDAAKVYGQVNIVTQTDGISIPHASTWQLNDKAAYAYYCPNETINGLAFAEIPYTKNVPLVADMTSNILATEIDVSKFGLIMAAAQKNLGIAGVTLVIVRDDLLEQQLAITPSVWNYKLLAEANSSLNTPPVFAIYVMDLVVDWLIKQGGIANIAKMNYAKASKLYDYIDNCDFYLNTVEKPYRSLINVPFNLADNRLVNEFVRQANDHNLKYLAGHASVGGLRVSLYNAMPEAGVNALIEFMRQFAKNNG